MSVAATPMLEVADLTLRFGSVTAFRVHPLMCGQVPVNNDERDGVQSGWVT